MKIRYRLRRRGMGFVAAPGSSGGMVAKRYADGKVLYLQRHRITSESTRVSVIVDAAPCEAGIDPYNKLLDRVPSDNRQRVSLQASGPRGR